METTDATGAEECCTRAAASHMLLAQIGVVLAIVAIWLLCMGLI